MKKQIWKFELTDDKVSVNIPKGAKILTLQVQHETSCIWALVDPLNELEERHFEIYATGEEIHYDMGIERKYINTFQLQGGMLVFHVFERLN